MRVAITQRRSDGRFFGVASLQGLRFVLERKFASVTSRLSRTDHPCPTDALESRNPTLKRTSLSLAVL